MRTFKELLIELNACKAAREWAGDMTIEQVVEKCHRGDWLLWLAEKIEVFERLRYLAAGHCANTVRHLMQDERSRDAVDAVIAYGEGKIGMDELFSRKCGAVSAFADAAAEANAKAAAGVDSFTAAAYATNAAGAAAYACVEIYHSTASTDSKANQIETAAICRKYLGDEIITKVNQLLNQEL
jgi:hypothetical protein